MRVNLIVLFFLLCFTPSSVLADGPEESLEYEAPVSAKISPIEIRFGVQKPIFQCPCVRLAFRVKTLGGEIDTKYILISTEALASYIQGSDLQFESIPIQLVNVGAVEFLWKQGHIGLGFNGVTFGKDLDLGYENIIKTGAYLLLDLFRGKTTSVKLRTTYDHESYSVNRGPQVFRHIFGKSISMQWNTPLWRGRLSAYGGLEPRFDTNDDFYWRFGSAIENGINMVNSHSVLANVGIHLSYDYDSFRDALGLVAFETRGLVYVEMSWLDVLLTGEKK
jgi:hypothetical protein